MSRFTFTVRCLLVFTGIGAATAIVRAEEKPRPDIVFIIVDDLARRHVHQAATRRANLATSDCDFILRGS